MRPDSVASSPRTRRSSTIGSIQGDTRRMSTLSSRTHDGPSSRQSAALRSLPPSTGGYGATREGTALGLGLGQPESSQRPSGRDSALSSPRRISTAQSRSASRPPATAITYRSPAASQLLPSHEAYYAQSQPGSTTTPRFRDLTLPAMNPALSIPETVRHRRNPSAHSLASPSAAHRTPGGTMLKRLRRTASAVGLAIGNAADSYDVDVGSLRGEIDDEADEEMDEGMKANGTRVWYRCAVLYCDA
jgi:hypothetical protein